MGLEGESSKFVDILVQCSLRQMLENGFFHADPHAGNLLAMPSGKLCFLDFGMVSYVESQQRYSIIEAVVHLVNRDFEALARLYRRMGFIPANVELEPLVQALEKALPDVLNSSVGELNIKNIINKLGDVMFRFPFALPPYYISIIRCLGVLEGVALQVDQNFRIIEDAYVFCSTFLLDFLFVMSFCLSLVYLLLRDCILLPYITSNHSFLNQSINQSINHPLSTHCSHVDDMLL
jgi:aarF domain-containing kinase